MEHGKVNNDVVPTLHTADDIDSKPDIGIANRSDKALSEKKRYGHYERPRIDSWELIDDPKVGISDERDGNRSNLQRSDGPLCSEGGSRSTLYIQGCYRTPKKQSGAAGQGYRQGDKQPHNSGWDGQCTGEVGEKSMGCGTKICDIKLRGQGDDRHKRSTEGVQESSEQATESRDRESIGFDDTTESVREKIEWKEVNRRITFLKVKLSNLLNTL